MGPRRLPSPGFELRSEFDLSPQVGRGKGTRSCSVPPSPAPAPRGCLGRTMPSMMVMPNAATSRSLPPAGRSHQAVGTAPDFVCTACGKRGAGRTWALVKPARARSSPVRAADQGSPIQRASSNGSLKSSSTPCAIYGMKARRPACPHPRLKRSPIGIWNGTSTTIHGRNLICQKATWCRSGADRCRRDNRNEYT